MNRYYHLSNADVIVLTAEAHDFVGDRFWWKIDRVGRSILDEATGHRFEIPHELELT